MAMGAQNPLVLAILSLGTFIVTAGFTGPSSPFRNLNLLLMITYVAIVLSSRSAREWFSHPIYPNLLGGITFSTLLQYIDQVVLQRWTYEAQGPTGPTNARRPSTKKQDTAPEDGALNRLKFGLDLTFNKRRPDTPWAMRNIPPFDSGRPGFVPSRGQFITKSLFRCVVCILLLDLIGLAGRDTSQNHVLFDQRLVPFFSRLREVTPAEVLLRFMTSALTGLATYLLFQAIYSGCAVTMVVTGLNTVESWRPLFGSFTDCTSLRGVWNKWWHQGMGTTLTVPSRYIATEILQLPKGSVLQRYVYIMLVFQLSGLVHIVGDVASGLDIKDSGVMHWFSIQALGFAIEDSIAWLWTRTTGRRADEGRFWQKVLGFIWVIGWFIWTMPVWTYPISRKSEGEGILPFTIIGNFI